MKMRRSQTGIGYSTARSIRSSSEAESAFATTYVYSDFARLISRSLTAPLLYPSFFMFDSSPFSPLLS